MFCAYIFGQWGPGNIAKGKSFEDGGFDMIKQPFEECPRFDKCCVNHCPLDPKAKQRISYEFDPEKNCPLAKTIRQRIGEKYGLENRGLKPRELAARRIWEKMTPEQQETIRENARKKSIFLRLSRKGYCITRKAGDECQTHKQTGQDVANQGIPADISKSEIIKAEDPETDGSLDIQETKSQEEKNGKE